jgi:2-methylcitrate dehydratase PrpD
MTLTRQLATFASDTGYERLPSEVVGKTKMVMMDTLGCAIAGYTIAAEELAPLLRLAKAQGGAGKSTIFCDGHRTTASQAALANGGIIHTIDFDDTSATCFGHFGATLLPAVAALGQELGAGGEEAIAAFAVGYEIAVRVGRTVWPSHYDRWHPTATMGTIGAAVAAGKLLRFDAVKMDGAISLAADEAAGLRYCIDHGDFSKLLHPAMAAMKGVMAALLIDSGAAGPLGLLEYKSGFCSTFSFDPRPEAGVEALGARFEIMNDIIKAYPTINCAQAPIQGMLEIATRHGVVASDIERIHLTRMYRYSSKEQGVTYSPDNVLAARLSIPYCLSLAAHRCSVTLDDFTRENLNDSSIVALMNKVEIVMDEALNREYPGGTAAMVLRVRMKDGREFEQFVRYPKGNPNNPMSADDVQAKFATLAARTLHDTKIRALSDMLLRLETLPDVGELMDAVRLP